MDSHARGLPWDLGGGALQRLDRAPGKGQNPAPGTKPHLDRLAVLRAVPHPPPGAECHVSKEAVRLWLRGELVCSVPRVAGSDEPQLRRRPHLVLFRQRGGEA